MDFDNPKVYSDTSITDGLVQIINDTNSEREWHNAGGDILVTRVQGGPDRVERSLNDVLQWIPLATVHGVTFAGQVGDQVLAVPVATKVTWSRLGNNSSEFWQCCN